MNVVLTISTTIPSNSLQHHDRAIINTRLHVRAKFIQTKVPSFSTLCFFEVRKRNKRSIAASVMTVFFQSSRVQFHLRWFDKHNCTYFRALLSHLLTYQERAKKVKSTEIDNGSDCAATTSIFIRIALGIVETVQHYFMPIFACGSSAIEISQKNDMTQVRLEVDFEGAFFKMTS